MSHVQPRTLDAAEIQQHVDALKTDGYTVIPEYIPADTAAALCQQTDGNHHALVEQGAITFSAPVGLQSSIAADKIINTVIYYDQDLMNLATAGDHLKVYGAFLNDPYYGLIPKEDANFILAQANVRAGGTAIPYHVDVRMKTPGWKTWSMQGILALGPKNSQTGGLKVIPQSHLLDTMPDSKQAYAEESVDVDLKPGDMAVFSSQLHHATHPTAAGETAGWAMLLTYRCWWAKPQFDLLAMLTPEHLDGLTDNQKLLLGACSRPSGDITSSPSSRTGYAGMAV